MSPVWRMSGGCSGIALTRSIVCVERAGDIGIGVLVEADMGVADLHEERRAGDVGFAIALPPRSNGMHAAREREQRACAAISQTLSAARRDVGSLMPGMDPRGFAGPDRRRCDLFRLTAHQAHKFFELVAFRVGDRGEIQVAALPEQA